jgi:hypothetical protein
MRWRLDNKLAKRAWAMIYAAVGGRLAIFRDRGCNPCFRSAAAGKSPWRPRRQAAWRPPGRVRPLGGQDVPMVPIHQQYQESVRQSDKSLKRPSR